MRLVYIALGWSFGILLAAGAPVQLPVIWLLLVLAAAVSAWMAWWSRFRWFHLALVALTLGGFRFSLYPDTSDLATYNNLGGLTLQGIVSAEPVLREDRQHIRLDASTVTRAGVTQPVAGTALIYASRSTEIRYGDQIAATGLLVQPGEADTFSYADYLARSGTYSIMTSAAVDVLSRGHGNSLFDILLHIRDQARTVIADALPEPAAGLLTGIILGDERGIAPDLREAFAVTGAAHILAVSGFNMVVLSRVVSGLLSRFQSRRSVEVALSLIVIFVYALLAGATPAILRAALMSSLLVIAGALRRQTYVPASLALALLLLSFLNPTVLWDTSFQLSFFATVGIALFARPFGRALDRLLTRFFPRSLAQPAGDFLNEPLVVGLAAQIAVTPLLALYFHQLSPVSLLVNLLIVPVQAWVLMLGGLATLIAFVAPLLAQPFYWLVLVLLGWTTSVVRLSAALPMAAVEFYVSPSVVALFFVLFIGGAMLRATQPDWLYRLGRIVRARAVVTATIFGGLAIAVLTGALALSRPDGMLHVWFLDMGHSNAVLVQTPGGAHILVDGGRYPARLLTALGDRLPFTDRQLEVLVLTQPDENEYGALPTLLDRYDVGVVLTNGQPNQNETYLNLQRRLALQTVLVTTGYHLDFSDGARLDILHPVIQPGLDDPIDDHTLVLRLTHGEIAFLLSSDISLAGQAELLASGQWPLATVLQLPRHGAARSLDDTFYMAVQPQLVVLQSDPANRRGDPDADTLARLQDQPLYRTDEQGTLHVWTDGESLWVEPETVR